MEWAPMKSAPRDGTEIMVWHKHHGPMKAWFSPGSWSDDTPISPAEYDGAVWVLGDDLAQEEVEEYPDDAPAEYGLYGDGDVLAWCSIPPPPKA
jgi:hypothetical protein